MKSKFLYFCTLFHILLSGPLQGQTAAESFMSRTEIIGTLYSSFHFQLNEQNLGFDVERAYLGFTTQTNEKFALIMKLDIGSPDDVSAYSRIKRYAYFKNAAMVYSDGKFTIRGGIIDTYQFKFQERFWARRYIYRSFQDEYRFTPSADIGIGLSYDPNDWLTADISFMNGEGYTKLQVDNSFKTGLGLTLQPYKFLSFRLYYDFISKNEVLQSTFALFAGFRIEKFNLGAEMNYRVNDEHFTDRNKWGYSIYSTYHFARRWEVFGRFDFLTSKTLEGEDYGWNYSNDGSALMGGVQFAPTRFLKLALNYRDWVPYPPNLDSSHFIYLNLEFKL